MRARSPRLQPLVSSVALAVVAAVLVGLLLLVSG
jgi:cell division protein FtsN